MQQRTGNEPPQGTGIASPTRGQDPGASRHSAAGVLVALVAMIVVSSLVENLRWGRLIEALLITSVLVFGVRAVGGRARTLFFGILLALPAVVGKWIDHFWPGVLPPAPFLSFTIAFVAFVGYHLLRFVLTARKVDSEVLCASIAVYLLMGICWTFTYILVGKLIPDAFVFSTGGAGQSMIGFEAAYFSFVTLTTCGFGDVVPVANVARMLAVLEAVTGMFYVAILIARLVSVYSSSAPSGQNNGHSEVQS